MADLTPERIQELRQQKYNATVVRLKKLQTELMIIRVRPDRPLPPHLPGQYTSLGLGYWEPRHPDCQEEHLQPGDEGPVRRKR